MMKRIVLIVLTTMILSGCAVRKEMVPMGGSKADGTVRMGYTVGQFEKPVVDLNQAASLAAQKCKTWGYEGAEPFGGQTSQCGQMDGFGSCIMSNVSVEYQCTGGKAAQN
ncbi:YecR-like lipofamily protein [Enterobacter sp. RD4-1-1]|uniref:YecR-like lipofamily protein n=1 Tax=Enterobacter sp. RD4-1-1 TaxID=2986135 RepID=UPI0021E9A56B|nr:YecR-like lipofamily protein [Enterobacter sp. RD4-1-1]MCV3771416.1 YecR-like lipofamily protein [Enterobacter sp. RD4-1-1]